MPLGVGDELAESVVTSARRLGLSSLAITLGYYAHFMPEAGGKRHGTADGLLGGGGTGLPAGTPRILPGVVDRGPRLCAPTKPSVDGKAEEMGGLEKCWKRS
ncbi:hypothetical protein GCM10010393_46220 [Streptomyces gobitricini]|uniref:Uncharacterized protein n=1 Tax=Streptomyces gobitricini TaxID=68211 RepID=A0ABN3MST8_9ACTN